jgi:hypothetical protein
MSRLNSRQSFGLNSRLKKFNELFDTDDIKSRMEIPILQGLIDFKQLASTPTGIDTDSQFVIFHDKLAHFHTFLEQCLISNNPKACGAGKDENGIFKYYFSDGIWLVVLSIEKEAKGSFLSTILYRRYDLEMTEENLVIIKGSNPNEYDETKAVIEVYEDLPFEELINGVIDITLKDVLTDLGLGSFLNTPLSKELDQANQN